jgi:hypothetical protein
MAVSNRTHDKLRFARAVLDDLKERPGNLADDFQRARQEAFLFHLFGAGDAFLHEVNEHYRCGLAPDKVTLRELEAKLQSNGLSSPQLAEIRKMEKDKALTLGRLKEWRDNSTHRSGVPINYNFGGKLHGKLDFHDPATGNPTGRHVTDDFEVMLAEVTALIDRWRRSLA